MPNRCVSSGWTGPDEAGMVSNLLGQVRVVPDVIAHPPSSRKG
jgi:hypothetical protein